eukprot:337834_1
MKLIIMSVILISSIEGKWCPIWKSCFDPSSAADVSDVSATETNDIIEAASIVTSCPIDRPNSDDECNFEDICNYGTQSCCIEDKMQTFDSLICKCDDGLTLCIYNEQCMMARATCEENPSDINMRRRLIVTNDYSVTMIIGALIVLSIIIGVLIVFHYKQKRAAVYLLANQEPISVV